MKTWQKWIVGVAVVVALAIWGFDTLKFWGEKAELNNQIIRCYFGQGRKAAERALDHARPWLESVPPGMGRSRSDMYGEYRTRIRLMPNDFVIGSQGPVTIIREIQRDHAFTMKEFASPRWAPIDGLNSVEVAQASKAWCYVRDLECNLNQIGGLAYEPQKCRNRTELQQKREEFQALSDELEERMRNNVPIESPPKDLAKKRVSLEDLEKDPFLGEPGAEPVAKAN